MNISQIVDRKFEKNNLKKKLISVKDLGLERHHGK